MKENQHRTDKGFFTSHWTAEEEKLLASLWADHSVYEIMPYLPLYNLNAIKAKANRMGLKKDFAAKKARGVRMHSRAPLRRDTDGHRLLRPVIAYEPDGVREFGSAREAAKHYGLDTKQVYKLIKSGGEVDGIGFNFMD